MASTIKVDQIETVAGTGTITLPSSNNLTVGGNATVTGTSTLTGNVTASGTLTSTGLITASAGLAVGGTGAANTLSDYEEGTWTANIIGSTTNPTTAVTSAAATYTKIGRLVYARFMIGPKNVAGASGGIRMNGLPFGNDGGHVAGNLMLYYRKSIASDSVNVAPYISGDQVYFYQTKNGAEETWGEILFDLGGGSTNFYMYGSLLYETDE